MQAIMGAHSFSDYLCFQRVGAGTGREGEGLIVRQSFVLQSSPLAG